MSGDFIDYLRELLADVGPVTARAMFGGHGLYRDGVLFAVAFEDGLYLKVDAQTQALFEAQGSQPFTYRHGGRSIRMSYWSAPVEAMDSAAAMAPWARLALQAAGRKPTQRRKGHADSVPMC